jgi:hypothetical protein
LVECCELECFERTLRRGEIRQLGNVAASDAVCWTATAGSSLGTDMVEADIALVSDSVIRRRLLYVRVSAENGNQSARARIDTSPTSHDLG